MIKYFLLFTTALIVLFPYSDAQLKVPCLHQGKIFPPGPVPSSDPCDSCQCLGQGKVVCVRSTVCQPLPSTCVRQARNATECCPRCLSLGCVDNYGQAHDVGKMKTRDPCENCVCSADQRKSSISCGNRTECPVIDKSRCIGIYNSTDECCPKCITDAEGCADGLGQGWPFGPVESNDPCQSCECKKGQKELRCQTKKCPPVTNCLRKVKLPGECCTRCFEIGCPAKNGTLVPVGPVDSGSICLRCDCRTDAVLDCKPVYQCNKLPPNCIRSDVPSGQCCPVCLEVGCFDKNKTAHPIGLMNSTVSGCDGCTCNADGTIKCGRLPCPSLTGCLEFDIQSGECCPNCTKRGCIDKYKNTHPVGKNISSFDPCLRACECLPDGQLKCPPLFCQPLPSSCLQAARDPDKCCPYCAKFGCRDDFSSKIYPLGIVNSTDPCKNCICQFNGRINCLADTVCPPISPACRKVEKKPNECCKKCLQEGCEHPDGKVYPVGPVPARLACEKNCNCYPNGKIICSPPLCKRECVDGVVPQGECCPICPNGKTCKINGKVVKFGEIVDTPSCSKCQCGDTPFSKPKCEACAIIPQG